MNWSVFAAVLVPLFLRQPNDPLWITCAHMALAAAFIAVADQIERRT